MQPCPRTISELIVCPVTCGMRWSCAADEALQDAELGDAYERRNQTAGSILIARLRAASGSSFPAVQFGPSQKFFRQLDVPSLPRSGLCLPFDTFLPVMESVKPQRSTTDNLVTEKVCVTVRLQAWPTRHCQCNAIHIQCSTSRLLLHLCQAHRTLLRVCQGLQGGSGFLGTHLVEQLLEKGYTVHATVRRLRDPDNYAHLKRLAAALPGNLELFKADLMTPGSFDSAIEGCTYVFHTA